MPEVIELIIVESVPSDRVNSKLLITSYQVLFDLGSVSLSIISDTKFIPTPGHLKHSNTLFFWGLAYSHLAGLSSNTSYSLIIS